MNKPATIIAPGTVRLERVLPGPAQRLWEHLTDEHKRGLWLAPGPIETRVGGAVLLRFNHADLSHEAMPAAMRECVDQCAESCGVVTRWEPPRVLAYTWGEAWGDTSEVTFELHEQGDTVRLVVTHERLADRDTMVNVAGGWDAHLGVLHDRLSNRTPRGFWTAHAESVRVHERIFAAAARAAE